LYIRREFCQIIRHLGSGIVSDFEDNSRVEKIGETGAEKDFRDVRSNITWNARQTLGISQATVLTRLRCKTQKFGRTGAALAVRQSFRVTNKSRWHCHVILPFR